MMDPSLRSGRHSTLDDREWWRPRRSGSRSGAFGHALADRARECDEFFELLNVAAVVARSVNRCLRDKGCVRKTGIVEQPPEWLKSNRSLPYMLVTVEF